MNKVGPLPSSRPQNLDIAEVSSGTQTRESHDSSVETEISILTVTSSELEGPRFSLSPIIDIPSQNGSTATENCSRSLLTLPVITG